jgi:hypothetical protein
MTDNLIQFEGGEVLANLEERTITGLLIPFGEEGRTNVGRFQVEAGAVRLPADPAVVGINLDHERPEVVGRATRVWEEPRGVMATFQIARTPEGDAALADATSPAGRRRKLSGEFGPAMIRAGKLVAGHAKLWGAALVEAGAFPSAQVLAADTPEPIAETPAPAEPAEHVEVELEQLPDDITVTTPAGDSAVYTPEAAPAEDNPNTEGGSTVTATATAGAPAPAAQPTQVLASVPPTMIPGAAPAKTELRPIDAGQVLAAIAAVKANPGDADATQVLAALTDVKFSGTGALPTTDVLRPNWLGQLYQGVPYVREYIGLATLGTNISAAGKKGFKVYRGTEASPLAGPHATPQGGSWDGNKAEINSYGGFTTTSASTLRRFAVGQDVAREFYDLPGGEEVVRGFLDYVIEDHLFWSDMWGQYDIIAASGVPVAPTTYPTNYPASLGMLIQGILAVKARKADKRRDVPTYAIVNELAYAELVYAAGGEQNLPAFVSIAVSTNSGGTIDGSVEVVQGDTGITATASVIVGAKRAIEFDELPGGPLIINALDLAKGGVDRAVHGYLQSFPVRSEAIVHIGTTPTRANTTAYQRGAVVKLAGGEVLRATGVTTAGQTNNPVASGTSGGSAPTAPAVGATVTDGSVIWTRLS